MAALNENQRTATHHEAMQEYSNRRTLLPLTKAEVRATVDAVDDWVDTHRASYNSALPAAAQANLTAAQKAEFLLFVVRKRFLEGV